VSIPIVDYNLLIIQIVWIQQMDTANKIEIFNAIETRKMNHFRFDQFLLKKIINISHDYIVSLS
jgi:hypothetical protein